MSGIPRLVSLVALGAGTELEYESPATGGVVVVEVPSGYYWPLGSHGRVSTATTSTTHTMSGGHRLVVGDVVDLWRAGTRIVESLRVTAATATTATVSTSITTQVGDRLVMQGDLIGTLEAVCAEHDDNARFSIDASTGRVTLSSAAAGTNSFTWTTAQELAALLRFDAHEGIDFSLASPATGDGAAYGSLYPSRPVVDERLITAREREAYEADDGTMRVQTVATKKRVRVRLSFLGDHRGDTHSALDDFEDFITHASEGYLVRYYPDRDVHERYARTTQPWGFETYSLMSPLEFDPDPVIARSRDLWEVEIELQQQSAASSAALFVGGGGWAGCVCPESETTTYTTLAALTAALTDDGDYGVLVNATSGLPIAHFERRNGLVIPVGPWDLTHLTANRWARVASVTSSTEVELEPGHNLSPSAFCRVADTSAGTATTVRSFTVTGTTLTLGTGYSSIAAGDLIYESGTSEIEFGLDVLVAADGASYNDAPAVYATGGGLHIEQAAVALLLPSEIDLTAPDACGFDVRIIGESSRQAAPVDADGGVVAFAVAGVMTRHSGTVRVNRAEYQWDDAASNTTLLRRYVNSAWPLEFSGAASTNVSTMTAPPGDLLLGWQGVIGNLGTASTSQLGTLVRWNTTFAAQTSAVSGAPSANSLSTLLGMVTACAQRTARTSGTNYDPTLLVKSIDFGLVGF